MSSGALVLSQRPVITPGMSPATAVPTDTSTGHASTPPPRSPSWRAAGWYQDLTVGEAIAAGARQHPDDELIFVRHGGGATAVRLATLHERALDVAGRLYRAGVRPGDRLVVPPGMPHIFTATPGHSFTYLIFKQRT